MEGVSSNFAELESILQKYGHARQAAVVRELRHLEQHDPTEFARRIRADEMWGGAGAVWEVSLSAPNLPHEEVQRDVRRLRTILSEIAAEMDAHSLGTSRSRDVAAALRYWADRGFGQSAPYVRPTRSPDLEADVELFSTEDGGRVGPARSGYRPTHDFGTGTLSDAQHEYPDGHWLFPGNRARAFLWLSSTGPHRERLSHNGQFTIQEGGRIVGRGRILAVVNESLRAPNGTAAE